MYGCAAYAHRHKIHRSNKLHSRENIGIYTESNEGLHLIYFRQKRELVADKHAVLEKISVISG